MTTIPFADIGVTFLVQTEQPLPAKADPFISPAVHSFVIVSFFVRIELLPVSVVYSTEIHCHAGIPFVDANVIMMRPKQQLAGG